MARTFEFVLHFCITCDAVTVSPNQIIIIILAPVIRSWERLSIGLYSKTRPQTYLSSQKLLWTNLPLHAAFPSWNAIENLWYIWYIFRYIFRYYIYRYIFRYIFRYIYRYIYISLAYISRALPVVHEQLKILLLRRSNPRNIASKWHEKISSGQILVLCRPFHSRKFVSTQFLCQATCTKRTPKGPK